MNFTILRFDEIDSTNTEALNQARRGAAEGLCVVARRQTAGRGRKGRVWVSEKDAGLFFSLVLRPKIEARFLPLVTLMTAIAVHDALEALYELDCDIKWVNDIHTGGRKISGILAETCDSPKGSAVVVGIGVNLKSSNFPPEIAATATSVEAETNKIPNVETLLQKLTFFLSEYCDVLYSAIGPEKIRAEWLKRSSYAFGKPVRVVLENETIHGITRGIEENGALRVRQDSGEMRIIHAGDVENLREDSPSASRHEEHKDF
jgi:BirA family transcriptional regulator, biotin operon repressor / biotin---[acetyl-CoA-carboxylase] ligase